MKSHRYDKRFNKFAYLSSKRVWFTGYDALNCNDVSILIEFFKKNSEILYFTLNFNTILVPFIISAKISNVIVARNLFNYREIEIIEKILY